MGEQETAGGPSGPFRPARKRAATSPKRGGFLCSLREFADAPRDPAAKPMAPKTTERIHDGDDFAFGKIEF